MRFIEEYDFLSNLFPCKVTYKGNTYPSVETAFQYLKCKTEADKNKFFDSTFSFINGYDAKKIGRTIVPSEEWKENYFCIMYELLESKFAEEELKKRLKETGETYIAYENDIGETFWGVCNGEGQNMLGKMIMEIRENILKEKPVRRIIVAGSRSFKDYNLLKRKLDVIFKNITPIIICGEARGADTLGKQYANERKYEVRSFYAHWENGKSAGIMRNYEMAENADALVAFWDGKSKGTKHMIDVMKRQKKQVRIILFGRQQDGSKI